MQIIDAVLRLKDNFTGVIQKATKNIDEHRSQQLRTAKSIQQTGKSITALGDKFALLSAPILAAATAGAKLNSDFTVGLAKVSTLVDTTVVDMGKMRSELIALSNETGVSVTELTEGTYQAISASVDASKAVDFMRISALGAKAGFTNMTTATDALTTIINAYGMETERASDMMDRLIVTQNLGKTTVDEVGKSIGQVIPTAASAGMSIDELLSSVASLTASGTQTSAAMTGLKAALSNIIKPSKDAFETAEALGLQFNQAHLQAVGWAQFLDEIKTATGGNVETMAKLFGSTEALNTVLSLTGNGANKFRESLDTMADSTGATNEAIKKLDATPAAQLEKAVNQLKNAAMELAQGLTPLLSRTSRMTKAFAEWLANLSPLQKDLLFGMAQFIVIGGVALSVVGRGITLFGGWYGSIVKASSAISKAGSVTGALAAKFPFLQTVISGVMNGLRSFGGILGSLRGNFVNAISTIGRAILSLRNPLMAIRVLMATNPIGLALLALSVIIPFVIAHFNDFKQVILVVFNHIRNTVSGAMDKVQAKFSKVMEKLEAVGDKFSLAYNRIMSAFGATTEESGSKVSVILNTLGAVFETVFDLAIIVVTGFVSVYADIIGTVIDVAGDLISFVSNVFTGNWSAAWSNIADIFGHIIDGIKNVFSSMIDTLSSGLDYILEKAGMAQSASAEAGGEEIPGHAIGTSWFAGGKTWIHEKGAEIVDLPTGTRIIPHDESLKQQYRKGLEKGRTQQPQGQTISIAKLADSIVVKEKEDIDRLTEQIVFKIQQAAINNMVGAV
ncbi:phage tail tape measure protein [uncultured Selenomonas sp.]|uniref:phage tail tape measure protein n=1 Tax=uncultured Selenomonas sp. TaxID=159275 RepID=UPI0028DD0E3F|nr:phage tail tape measure protein [uncultured Selenomonas sp.]